MTEEGQLYLGWPEEGVRAETTLIWGVGPCGYLGGSILGRKKDQWKALK